MPPKNGIGGYPGFESFADLPSLLPPNRTKQYRLYREMIPPVSSCRYPYAFLRLSLSPYLMFASST